MTEKEVQDTEDTPPRLPSFKKYNPSNLAFSDAQREVILNYAYAARSVGTEAGIRASRRTYLESFEYLNNAIHAMVGMAESMELLRDDLIEVGVISKKVPPMMMTEAIFSAIRTAYELGCSNDPLEELFANNKLENQA